MRRHLRLLLALAFVFLAWPVLAAEPVRVFAAASLRESMTAAGAAFTKSTGTPVTFSFAGSNAIARQIEQGAPADVVVTADAEWMDWLAERRLIQAPTRKTLLGNTLVLIAPAGAATKLTIRKGFPLAQTLGGGHLALADPAVPAGRYGRAALGSLGVWDSVAGKTAPAADVRAALAYVARGEAPLGVVYATDAKAEPKVRTVAVFPASSHDKIVYPGAVVTGTKNPQAAAFLRFLQGAQAKAIFRDAGFNPL
ncbi:molybdate ABC transporter substrate-binding protein [Caulobacter segnis]|uniref:molybdate ABC transporter substrate-binding protein n=1 Tax=Caulobacter segnis TaxID=88688 RepID=UPI0024108386|nr:molybdate ABC transporter substrate-binding protein [Caulobacter segnis]MDG2521122.1 molybdate ABC transporter substrate-binding protein [Caulobacter segnis]